MGFSLSRNIPRYFALLPIFAVLSQLAVGGEIVKLLLKAGIIVVFLFLFFINGDMHISRSYVGMAFILVVNTLITCIANNGNILTMFIDTGINVIIMLFLYDRAKRCKQIKKNDILWFYKIFAYFILISCIYNLIINYWALLNIYSLTVYSDNTVASFFDNKNTFGVFLVFGVLAAAILHKETEQKKWIIISVIFLLNEVVAMCRTAIILSMLLIVANYLTCEKTMRRKIVGVATVSIVLILVWCYIPQVRSLFEETIFGDTQSLEVRTNYVKNLLPNITGIHILVGYGSDASALAYRYTGNVYFHNTFLQAYAYGGLFRLLLLLSYIRLSFYYCLKLRTRNKEDGTLSLISLMIYCIYSFSEAIALFDSQVISMVATAFVISLPILLYNASCNENFS